MIVRSERTFKKKKENNGFVLALVLVFCFQTEIISHEEWIHAHSQNAIFV